ncbi:MAG: tRNA pseudouridine(55) synthase TruB [Thermodesulfobacteriales bacterium]|nr:MAG: tRNA pseudouridine(55) synthase TruB [Thermodesulfobacteriales bacterium]
MYSNFKCTRGFKVNGVLILDKPKGITSQQAVTEVNKIVKAKRAGHTGTLDPFATGVLPICFNNATKIIPYMKNDFKKYEALIHLGISTDTLDNTGKVLKESDPGILNKNVIIDAFSKYKGTIKQIPPMFSAIKKDGVRLYKLARKGIEVQRAPREVTINEIELLEFESPFIRFKVECSRGTYIRVLAEDISNDLGCGGHLTELRRIESDGFNIDKALTIEDIKNGHIELTSLNDVLSHMMEINVSSDLAFQIRQGKQIKKSHMNLNDLPDFKIGDHLKIYENSSLVSITEASVDSSELGKLDDQTIIFKLLRVFN